MAEKYHAPSSRRLAQSWPYTRHARFEELLRESNAAWFLLVAGIQAEVRAVRKRNTNEANVRMARIVQNDRYMIIHR
jgi:hypothetical protein